MRPQRQTGRLSASTKGQMELEAMMARKRATRRGARCASAEMPDWRALALSVALTGALLLTLHS